MTTPKQTQANRKNGKKSQGPKTDAGKKTSSQNAVKHGLTADTTVLPGEDQVEYDQLRAALFEEDQPVGITERFCVDEKAHCIWNLLRGAKMRYAIVESTGERLKIDAVRTLMAGDLGEAMQDLERFEAAVTARRGVEKMVEDDRDKEDTDKLAAIRHQYLLDFLPDLELLELELQTRLAARQKAHAETSIVATDGPTVGEIFIEDTAQGEMLGKLLRYETTWRNRLSKAIRQLDDLQDKRRRVSVQSKPTPATTETTAPDESSQPG